MTKRTTLTRVEKLKLEKEKLAQKIKEETVKLYKQEKKDSSRKKFLLGELVLEAMGKNKKAYPELIEQLEKTLTSNRDRALFNFPLLVKLVIEDEHEEGEEEIFE